MGNVMKKMKNIGNQGFSLVELVVVMAIIIVLGSAVVYGLTFLASKPVEECARKVEVALQGNRNTTMGKLSSSISFYTEGDKIVVLEQIDTSSKTTIIGNGVEVYYTYKSNPTNRIALGNSASPLKVEFERSSGSLKPQAGTTDYLQSIIVKRGSKELTVNIERLTGRVTIN